MDIGKLPDSLLNKIIIDPVSKNSVFKKEVITAPSIGEDCAAIDFGGDICLMSTDPITGAAKDIGRLAVYVNTNDIAAGGGTPLGIMVTALLPPSITEDEISTIITDLCESAHNADIAILGGHTEITDAVTKPVLSCTVVGKCKKPVLSGGAKAGDAVIMTKYAALEGTSIIAEERDFCDVDKAVIEKIKGQLSVIKEGKICAEIGVNAMHDITEGGVLGACWETASCSGKGIEVYCDSIPILSVTQKICTAAGIDPLKLISSGSMLITTDKADEVLNGLEKNGIKASVIGKITESGCFKIQNGVRTPLDEPECDELYRALK